MIYDGVITKPELTEDNMLMHWGVKGMKWRKRLKGKYYSTKSKTQERIAKVKRTLGGVNFPEVETNRGKIVGGSQLDYERRTATRLGLSHPARGKYISSQGGRAGSRVDEGITAGRKRALNNALKKKNIENNRPRARKKNVVAGKGSVKKRK